MNDGWPITKENILSVLPKVLAENESLEALARADAELMAARALETDLPIIFARIDELPEALLDILAKDFKVDWWDGDYTLAEKRQTLKDSWHVHHIMGTKASVVTAISAIYNDTGVQEWWEYGGQPYHFRLLINSTYENVDPVKYQRVLDRVAYYKPLRSVMDEVEFFDGGTIAPFYVATAFAGAEIIDGCVAAAY